MPVTLFYWYTDINDVQGFADRLRAQCSTLNLGGRVRISPEGINGTIGCKDDDLKQFQSMILQELNNAPIDFKTSPGGSEHFGDNLRIRICNEVVTLGTMGQKAGWRQAGKHLTPSEFRDEMIQCQKDTVILDARNEYESAIGKFHNAITPDIRQFADFPQFVKNNLDLFKGKRVFMYCTGGVRCERGSALVKVETEAESVVQLHGGIETFLNVYPDGGGVFKGRNLVFDGRLTTAGPVCDQVVGKCLRCNGSWDDYSRDIRCRRCRGRVLICDTEGCESKWEKEMKALCVRCSK